MSKCRAYPSLALIKYWGKKNEIKNTPASSSLAITVDNFYTETEVKFSHLSEDIVILNNKQIPLSERYKIFFNEARKTIKQDVSFSVNSFNNFPTAAGLASSSSGFASIASCILKEADLFNFKRAASLARIGSASASRAVYGGFTVLKEGALYAKQIKDENYWPELSVIFLIVSNEEKLISSRTAMNITKKSIYYKTWVLESKKMFKNALKALDNKDFKLLGENILKSYLAMFSLLFSSSIIYWKSDTIKLLCLIKELRESGVLMYETMDAGPQIKIICLKKDINLIVENLKKNFNNLSFKIASVGSGLKWI